MAFTCTFHFLRKSYLQEERVPLDDDEKQKILAHFTRLDSILDSILQSLSVRITSEFYGKIYFALTFQSLLFVEMQLTL